ncbi:MAG: sigma-70 family RNA polymerase sigma factor [Treponemataceae bacterium]
MLFKKNKTETKIDLDDFIVCKIVLNGNTEAFRILIEKYQARIFNLGFSFFKNADDANDFVQDVMIKAFLKLHTFKGKSKFSTWLMSIAYNTAINSSKKKRDYTSFIENYDCASMAKTPEQQYLEKEMVKAVKEAVSFLPEKYRICVDLYFFYGMPYADIEKITKFPVNTIKSNVFRAKKILKEKLAENSTTLQSDIADAYAFLFKKAFMI